MTMQWSIRFGNTHAVKYALQRRDMNGKWIEAREMRVVENGKDGLLVIQRRDAPAGELLSDT
jgi:hypothetical protein